MVTMVLFLFLLNVRTTFITLMAMPMSFAITLLTFHRARHFGELHDLGGLAVAIGMVVDDAIVDVENVFRRLRENAASAHPRPGCRSSAALPARGEKLHPLCHGPHHPRVPAAARPERRGGKLFAPIAWRRSSAWSRPSWSR
jgi:hypothetical protein